MARDTNPFQGVTDFFSEAARVRQVAVGRSEFERTPEHQERTHATAWVPATDIFARGDDLVIRIDLAGVDPQDVEITYVGNMLSLDGERRTQDDPDDDGDSFYIRERFHGRFRRSITLPDNVDADQIEAEFDHGLVEIVVRGGAAADGETQRIELKKSRSAAVRRRPSRTRQKDTKN